MDEWHGEFKPCPEWIIWPMCRKKNGAWLKHWCCMDCAIVIWFDIWRKNTWNGYEMGPASITPALRTQTPRNEDKKYGKQPMNIGIAATFSTFKTWSPCRIDSQNWGPLPVVGFTVDWVNHGFLMDVWPTMFGMQATDKKFLTNQTEIPRWCSGPPDLIRSLDSPVDSRKDSPLESLSRAGPLSSVQWFRSPLRRWPWPGCALCRKKSLLMNFPKCSISIADVCLKRIPSKSSKWTTELNVNFMSIGIGPLDTYPCTSFGPSMKGASYSISWEQSPPVITQSTQNRIQSTLW